jgi:hypothetical protein
LPHIFRRCVPIRGAGEAIASLRDPDHGGRAAQRQGETCMLSIATKVEQIVSESAFLTEGMALGLINLSELARQLRRSSNRTCGSRWARRPW